MQFAGTEHLPPCGPLLVTTNHYYRPGFRAWWLPLAVSAAMPAEIHWVITAALTKPDWIRAHTFTPFSRWLLKRVTRVYSFTSMPAMPPHPSEVEERARAVREVLTFVHANPQAVIGLAPEGRDSPDVRSRGGPSTLQWPPPGAGRFIAHLSRAGLLIAPVGLFESESGMWVHIGPTYELEMPRGARDDEDRAVSEFVMRRIAALLPERLRGEFD